MCKSFKPYYAETAVNIAPLLKVQGQQDRAHPLPESLPRPNPLAPPAGPRQHHPLPDPQTNLLPVNLRLSDERERQLAGALHPLQLLPVDHRRIQSRHRNAQHLRNPRLRLTKDLPKSERAQEQEDCGGAGVYG